MQRIKIKICGLKRAVDLRLCHELGVDLAGLVTEYPLPVPWNLTAEAAKTLLVEVEPPIKSCIVTGGSREKIFALAERLRPGYVQLHYRESLADAAWLAGALAPYGIGVIKTLPFLPEERLSQFGTADIADCVTMLDGTDIYAILADSRAPANAAGPGTLLDLDLYRQIKTQAHKPVILAGGLTAESLPAILASETVDFIDIMTGVESAPGVKEREKLNAVIKQIR